MIEEGLLYLIKNNTELKMLDDVYVCEYYIE